MVMFSATWPLAVHRLAQEFMDPNPIKVVLFLSGFCFQTSTWADSLLNVSLQVVIGSEDLAANHDVMQIVEVLDDRTRDSRLVALLDKYHQAQR